jgi:hypothetical protein
MPRRAALIRTRIWKDLDWRALAPFDKLVWFTVTCQEDVNHAGVIALRPRKWANALGVTEAQILPSLANLHTARFFVIDEEEQELLIRTHIRNDDVYKQSQLLKSAMRDLPGIASPVILEEIGTEVKRLLGEFAADVPKAVRPILEAMLSTLAGGSPEPARSPEKDGTQAARSLPEGFAQPESSLPAGSEQPLGDRGKGLGDLQGSGVKASTFSRPDIDDDAQDAGGEAGTAHGADEETKKPKVPKADLVPRADVDQLCEALAAHRIRLKCKPPTISQEWRTEARRLLDLDKRPLVEALAVLDWCQNDGFWSTNVESMPTFRRQYDKLRMRRANEADPPPNNVVALHGGPTGGLAAKHGVLARALERAAQQEAQDAQGALSGTGGPA